MLNTRQSNRLISFYYSYIGISNQPYGFLFNEASDGNLQAYIDQHTNTELYLRVKWCHQAAEAVHYIYQ